MHFIKFVPLVAGLLTTKLVSADLNPIQTPFNITAEFAPSGTYITCINDGRGVITLTIDPSRKQRTCSTAVVEATISGGGGCHHGVFAVRFSGPSEWTQHQPGVALDVSCFGPGVCSSAASIFGDHGNVVICKDPNQHNCDYFTRETWGANDPTPYIGLVWQPNGPVHSLIADPEVPSNAQDTLGAEL